MPNNFAVSLVKLIKDLSLKVLLSPTDPNQILISSNNASVPGLELTGFLDFFDKNKILIFGTAEHVYLEKLEALKRFDAVDKLLALNPPAIIMTCTINPHKEIISSAKTHSVHVLSTPNETSAFVTTLISYLNLELAPRITRHGVLVEVYGEGLLITGDSGIGKSETAVELIKRGHRLVADDVVEIRRVSSKTLIGTSPSNIKYFMELRGIGIINTRSIFGMGSVKSVEKIDAVIQLEEWENWSQSKTHDRMGIVDKYTSILGIDVSFLRIPVRPGRNLAIIIEVIAMNLRQRKIGQNAAKELLSNLGMGYKDDKDKDEE
ncbi:MAG: HPr(Ser) kinase/phosphatase [Oscillospiraceae bacterium]|jgi:HPr kinase/phosphorylase|nr:HPr(Ser) kinase/phosphatase [Oscillospiraceae bacterium]